MACVVLLWMAFVACDRRQRQEVPRLPFDVRPTMGALRLDCRTVRTAVERKNLRAGLQAVERLRGIRINRKNLPVPESFATYDRALREHIEALQGSMRANDQAGSETALAGMLAQCTSCHTTYRALGAEDGLLR